MALAIFDLDNTLLSGDSDYEWGQFLVEKGVVDDAEYRKKNDYFYAAYKRGDLDIMAFLEFSLRPLAQNDRETLNDWHKQFMQERILPMIDEAARTLVEKHRAQGDTLLVITATNHFVTEPIAKEFGVNQLIATVPEEIDGQYTGKVSGIPCFRDGKVTRLEQWMIGKDEPLVDAWFYSDSHNDLPLLKLVGHPVAVNPDGQLEARADEAGWPIIQLHRR